MPSISTRLLSDAFNNDDSSKFLKKQYDKIIYDKK